MVELANSYRGRGLDIRARDIAGDFFCAAGRIVCFEICRTSKLEILVVDDARHVRRATLSRSRSRGANLGSFYNCLVQPASPAVAIHDKCHCCCFVPIGIVRSAARGGIPSTTGVLPAGSGNSFTGPVTVAKYVWWTIYAPAMSMERSTELIDLRFRSWTYFAAWLTIAGLAAAGIWLHRHVPLLAAGLAGAAIALLPFAQVLKLYQSVAERYTYTASIGIVLAIVAILAAVVSKLRWPAWSAVVVLAVWIALSFMPLRERIHAWSSEYELYYTSLTASPKSAVLHRISVS